MKKILYLLTLTLLFLNGCAQSGNSSSVSQESEEQGAEDVNQPESQADNISLPEYDCSGDYYKLAITPAALDETNLLNYLIPDFDEGMVQQSDSAESMEYSVEMDGVMHTWLPGENTFLYFNDSVSSGSMTEEEAVSYGSGFVEHFGFDVAENPLIQLRGDEYEISYGFQYEGVPLLNDGGIDLMNGEEDGMAYCPSIQISVNENGIRSVFLAHLFDGSGVLEEYQGVEDFLDSERLNTIIKTALNVQAKQWKEAGFDYEYEVKEINVLYIPYEENGRQVVLPAFQVNGIIKADGVAGEGELLLLDAVSGRMVR